VNRQFSAQRPNQLWVSDFTYVSTWQGWLYVAFVVDVFARRIVAMGLEGHAQRPSWSTCSLGASWVGA
jgi:transposase InsO family protein